MTSLEVQVRELFASVEQTLRRAMEALHARAFFAHYPESLKAYPEEAAAAGKERFEAQLSQPFALPQASDAWLAAEEASPYTAQPLGISYPAFQDPQRYVDHALAAAPAWRKASPAARAALLMDALERLRGDFFELAHATMHTTGQTFVMAFQASGPHASDRALETLALGLHELERFPAQQIEWVKPMGKFDIRMEKHFRAVPRGIGLCIGVSTFPVWNTLPGVFADLITGNPVIVKPHPRAIYPLALAVRALQASFAAYGFDPATAQLAPDTAAAPITTFLAQHPEVKLIDFTGGNVYGDFIEGLPGKITFTEKSGVNSVILDSVSDLGAAMSNLAFSVSMYSGQMCTCPQNFFIPRGGILAGGEHKSYEEVVQAFTEAVKGIATNPKMAAGVLGAIQSEATLDRALQARHLPGRLLLDSLEVSNPDFPQARMATPIVMEIQPDQQEVFSRELFGPVVLIVPVEDTKQGLALAQALAREKGAISCSAYSTDPEVRASIEEAMAESATSVSFNFTGSFWVNQNAGFSDFHVSGGNPSGNASLTDPAFINRRFTWVGSRTFIP
jgi:phenylacetic acid degradation protein paaN